MSDERRMEILRNWRSMNAAGMRIRMEHLHQKARYAFQDGDLMTGRAIWKQYKAAERRLTVLRGGKP